MKVPTGLSRREQDTFFRIAADQDQWDFYSRDPKFKRLLERKGYTVTEDHQGLWAAKIPSNAVSVRKQRMLSPEQREKWSVWGKQQRAAQEKKKSEPKVDPQLGPRL